jgi:hypothetical protein
MHVLLYGRQHTIMGMIIIKIIMIFIVIFILCVIYEILCRCVCCIVLFAG